MKYLCLVYEEESMIAAMPKQEYDALVAEHLAYNEVLERRGHLLSAESLQDVENAICIRSRGGRTSSTDGPFAETKEQLGGFYFIDARDMNDAIRIASQIPSVRHGTIEVRPIRELCPQQTRGDIAAKTLP